MRLNVTGRWPDEITIRTGWAKASGRSWNDDLPYGYLRLFRGSSSFLRTAANHVLSLGMERVASPPLAAGADSVWRKAGFEPFLDLHLYRRSLVSNTPAEDQGVRQLPNSFDELVALDRSSFDSLWRMNATGLRESFRATGRSVVLGIDDELGGVGGYAIVGVSGVTGYLQRIAVAAGSRRQGLGRRLVRAGIRWASHHGAATMLLNTQPDNEPSAALYRAEGFARAPGDLFVLAYPSVAQDAALRDH